MSFRACEFDAGKPGISNADGLKNAAASIHQACATVVADKGNLTKDLGGNANTAQITEAVLGKL